jgi:hypothetical protein
VQEPDAGTVTEMIAKAIVYFGKPAVIACDAKCNKAWGINNRPRVEFGEEDDYAYIPDQELGEAPTDPGTYEGGQGKPQTKEERLNKWCARECERSELGKQWELIELSDFSKPIYNMPWKHT